MEVVNPMEVKRMLAAELVRPGEVELRDTPVPDPGPGELLVSVETALTCGTDLKTFRRGHPKLPLPAPMGHEFSGVVAAVGAGVQEFHEGDPVACVPTAPCGECRFCKRGRENLCPHAVGRVVLGAFAEYVLLPEHIVSTHVFPRPAAMPPEIAATLEPLACVVHGAHRVALEQAETAVLLGDGPISLLFLQVARRAGAGRIMVVGRHSQRLEVASNLGADAVLEAGTEGAAEAVLEWTGGIGADVVIECVGSEELWEAAPGLASPGGEVLLFGGCPAGSRAGFDTYRVHYDEVDLKGSFHYTRADVRRAFEMLAFGVVDAAPLITHRRPLSELPDALELALSRRALKVAIEPEPAA